MVKWIIATWIAIVPWYLVTGATAGPEGPLGLAGPLGIIGFHVISALLTLVGAWCAWRWRRTAPGRASGILLAILIGLLIVATAAHFTMAGIAIATGATAAVFEVAAWRVGSITALLATLPIFVLLIVTTVVSAVGARRPATAP